MADVTKVVASPTARTAYQRCMALAQHFSHVPKLRTFHLLQTPRFTTNKPQRLQHDSPAFPEAPYDLESFGSIAGLGLCLCTALVPWTDTYAPLTSDGPNNKGGLSTPSFSNQSDTLYFVSL
ncbi:hypothetical protein H0G86_003432 [Trichoderma simmonsii]|uniref:Uncharacterized protein n=1 Tax=Trichoderma simmonsii TaxID=1491479 RepID=A0A8G0L5I0_9HYPO|nr:hypothetical protein H0G86_003432 [Trichoderma simmonsii]